MYCSGNINATVINNSKVKEINNSKVKENIRQKRNEGTIEPNKKFLRTSCLKVQKRKSLELQCNIYPCKRDYSIF